MPLDLSTGPLQFDPYRRGRFKPGPITAWCFVIFTLTVTWLILGTSSIQEIKNWMARGEAEEAIKAIQAEDWGHAVACIQKARSYSQEEPAVLRATITFLKLTESDPVYLSQQLRSLAEKQPLSLEDQLLLAKSLLKAGNITKARETFDALPEDARQQSDALALVSEIYTAEGRDDEARNVQQLAREKQPNSPAAMLEKALAQRNSLLEKDRQKARESFWLLTHDQTEVGLQAVTHLTVDPQLTWEETDKLLSIANVHSRRSLPVRLGIISARMRLRPELKEKMLNEEVARYEQHGGGELDEIARWLALEKQHLRVIRLVPDRLRRTSRELFPIVAQALAEEGRWKELKDMLTSEKPPVRRARVLLWLAEAESHLQPDDHETRHHLKSCIETARLEKDLSIIISAVTTAERLQQPDLALVGCQALLEHPEASKHIEILQKAADLAFLMRDTRLMLDFTRKLHALRPASTRYADQLAYLRLVLGEEIETVNLCALLESGAVGGVRAENEKRIPISLMESLMAYRLGDTESLRRYMSRLDSPENLPPGHRAVLSGLLAKTGETARAFQIAEKVSASGLLEEERAFLKMAR